LSRRDPPTIAQRFNVGNACPALHKSRRDGWTPGIQYIPSQAEHHRKMTFQEEFLALLKKQRIAYDERYLWE
jgi:hypothetical protein